MFSGMTIEGYLGMALVNSMDSSSQSYGWIVHMHVRGTLK